jgi:DGQHR domain-containing protein
MQFEFRVPAIEVTQGPDRVLYTFAVDGKAVQSFATISRIRRQEARGLSGYQRPEVLKHISEIRTYLEGDRPMLPNSMVMAFDRRVRFEAGPLGDGPGYLRPGTLVIPVDPTAADETKPGFIVDGQQRLAAIRDAAIGPFPICVTAFITDDVREQTEQFILVNSTKPLPKGLIYELLPATQSRLPTLLERRRFPAYLTERLNYDDDSPLKAIIQTPTNPAGVIKDNSILRMIENSLDQGMLYRLRAGQNGPDVDTILRVLKNFWGAVSDVFKDAWGTHPRKSRLMHGAGIVSLGFVMDWIGERYGSSCIPSREQFAVDLVPLDEVCRWTAGYWEFGPGSVRKWNEIQNTSKDIQLLSNYLLIQYKARVWSRSSLGRGVILPLRGGRDRGDPQPSDCAAPTTGSTAGLNLT